MVNPVEILHKERCSCVICHEGEITLCHGRGISDLYSILTENPQLLEGSAVADKVIGKGAAAIMILGGVEQVYADVISESAKSLFEQSGIVPEYAECVPNIINRYGTGICPVESMCKDCVTAEECMPNITEFITELNTKILNTK